MPITVLRRIAPVVPVVLAVTAATIAGCAGTTATTAPTTASSRSPTTSAPPETRGPGEDEGAFVFRTQCAACHGTRGEGNLGPPLVDIADQMSEADQAALVRSGKGRMPPFSPALSDDDIAAVVAYTRTQLR